MCQQRQCLKSEDSGYAVEDSTIKSASPNSYNNKKRYGMKDKYEWFLELSTIVGGALLIALFSFFSAAVLTFIGAFAINVWKHGF